MAQVKFFRRNQSTIGSSELTNMDSDSVYFLTSGGRSYIFYGKDSVGAAPDISYAMTAASSDGITYTLSKPYEFTPTYGASINVTLTRSSSTTTPTLDGVAIRRRQGNSIAAGSSSNWLQINTCYRLVLSKVGTTDYWIVEGKEQPLWTDIYGKPNVAVVSTATTSATAPTSLSSGQLYIIYDN